MVNLQNPNFVFHSETNSPGGVMQLIAQNQDIFLNFGPNVKNNHNLARQRGVVFGLPFSTAFAEGLRGGMFPPMSNLYRDLPGKPQNLGELNDLLVNSTRIEPELVQRQVALAQTTARLEHQGVIVSHPHEDAYGGVSYLLPSIPVVASEETLETIRLKEEISSRHQDEVLEIKRRDLPKVGRGYQTQQREMKPVKFGEPVALGSFGKNLIHKVDHMLGAGAIEVEMPNGGPRVVDTLDMGVGPNTENFINTVWGAGDVDLLVLDATSIGGGERFNKPQTNFAKALEEKVYAYPQGNAFVEMPQRHMQRLMELIEVGQRTKRKVFVPIDMAYYASTLLPESMQSAFSIYLPQRQSRSYVASDYPKEFGDIAFGVNGERNPGVLTIEEVVQEVEGDRSLVVLDNPNYLMQMASSGDVSHRNIRNPRTQKPEGHQNIYISAGYNYPTQASTSAAIDAAENAGLLYKEISITDHVPDDVMAEYLLNMTSKVILAVHTSNPENARAFVKRIQPKAIVPTISRSGLYEITGGPKGIRRVEL